MQASQLFQWPQKHWEPGHKATAIVESDRLWWQRNDFTSQTGYKLAIIVFIAFGNTMGPSYQGESIRVFCVLPRVHQYARGGTQFCFHVSNRIHVHSRL